MTINALKRHLAKIGSKGGKKRAENLSDEQRSESARKAVLARWAKRKKEA